MGGAELHGDLVVGAHAHAELGKAVARRDFCQQREVQRRLLVFRRDRHQPDDIEPERLAFGDERIGPLRRHARLARLLAGVDLDEAGQSAPLPVHLPGERLREPRPVQGLDHIEQATASFALLV